MSETGEGSEKSGQAAPPEGAPAPEEGSATAQPSGAAEEAATPTGSSAGTTEASNHGSKMPEEHPAPSGTGEVATGEYGEAETGTETQETMETSKPMSYVPEKPKPSPVDARRPRKRVKGEKIDLTNARIGFVGAGKMTEAIVKGLILYTKVEPTRIYVASKTGKNHEHYKQQGILTTKRNYDIFGKMDCDVVILAIHGYVIRQLYKMGGMRPMALTTNFIPNQRHQVYLLSLVGGVNLTDIKHTLLNPDNPEKYKIEMHRIMVNSSVAYGNGLAAIDIEPDSKKCSPVVRDLLTSFAKVEYIPESSMDCACAVGGNGLAFCYYFLSAVSDGGFKMGLPKNMAVKLATKTLQSAAASLLESGKHPSDLRDQSTSPSGPAIYGIHVLDKTDCASGIAAAVEGAHKRLKELVETPLA